MAMLFLFVCVVLKEGLTECPHWPELGDYVGLELRYLPVSDS